MARKRGQQEGSLRQREDGTWEGRVTLGWKAKRMKDGTEKTIRNRPSFYGATRQEVVQAIQDAVKSYRTGGVVKADRQTVGAFLDYWLEHSVKPSTKPRTYESYETVVRQHLKPSLGPLQISKLTPQLVQRLLSEKSLQTKPRRSEKRLSPRTVQYIALVLSRALNKAVKWGMLSRNVAALADKPRVPKHEIKPLDPEQARKLLAALEGHDLEALFTVAMAVGLRVGEALGLTWKDVDLKSGHVQIRRQLQRLKNSDGKWVFNLTEPKSKSAFRTLTLPEPALHALKAHKEKTEARESKVVDLEWASKDLIFSTPQGLPLDPSNVRRTLKLILKKADLPSLRVHDLRHTCATLLLVQGVHPRVVMEILGHSRIDLTLGTYSHVLPELRKEAAAKMTDLLKPKPATVQPSSPARPA